MSQENQMYVRLRGRVIGPYTRSELTALRDRGQFKPFHEVSTDKTQWVLAGTLTDIFQVPSRAILPTPGNYSSPQSTDTQPSEAAAIQASAEIWYYVSSENQQVGPVSEKTISELISSLSIGPTTLLWQSGLSDWTPAVQLFARLFSNQPSGAFPVPTKNSGGLSQNSTPRLQDPATSAIRCLTFGNIANLLLATIPPISSSFIMLGGFHALKVPNAPKVYSLATISLSGISVLSFVIFILSGSVSFEQTRLIGIMAWDGSLFTDPPTINRIWLTSTLVLLFIAFASSLAATTAATFLGSRLVSPIGDDESQYGESFRNLAMGQLAVSLALALIFLIWISLPLLYLCGISLVKASLLPRVFGLATLAGLLLLGVSAILRCVETRMLMNHPKSIGAIA